MSEAGTDLIYVCDQWEIDLGQRELRSRGVAVPLGGRAFEIVSVLVQTNDLVTKDHMMERVWPGVVVGEGTIHVHISAVRKALGPDRGLLKTVSGRGYRLLGSWTPQQRETPAAIAHPPQRRAAGAAPPNNFPPVLKRLIGRAAAAEQVRDLVSAYRVVTLTGPGGVGKTSLAVKAVRYLLAGFEDGGWIVELAPLSDPGLVPSTVAATLGLKLTGEISAESVARAIGGKYLLLVLDSCEHVIDAVANLAETFTRLCPRTTVVATSREILQVDGETVYRVPPLDVPAPGHAAPDYVLQYSAVELFVTRTKALNAGFSPQAEDLASIATICRRLDGIPLAIEFAAARAAALGIRQVATGLDDRFALLTAGRRTALPRQRTLRATLDWSHDLLPDAERRLLRRLGVFAGGFSGASAVAVMADTGLDAATVTDCIANLVTKSLIALDPTPGVTRWYLLETIRAYALEKLAGSDESDDAHRRHAVFFGELFATTAGSAPDPSADDLAPLVREIDNVRAALDWAFGDGGDPALAVTITAAATPVWIHHLLVEECKERIEQAIALISQQAVPHDPRRDVRLYSVLAVAYMESTGEASKIDDAWSHVADLAEELDDGEYRLRGLWGLWIGRYFNRDYRGALQVAMRLATLPDGAVEAADRLVGERVLGVTLHILGEQPRARVHIENMLRGYVAPPGQVHIQRYLFDQHAAARAFQAPILWLLGLPDQAMAVASRALDDATALGHNFSMLYVLAFGMLPVALERGDYGVTEQLLSRMFQWSETFRPMRVWGQCFEGVLRIRKGEPSGGLTLTEGLKGFPASGFQAQYLAFRGGLASSLSDAGDHGKALATIDEALDQSDRNDDRWYVAELLRIKGELMLRRNGPHAAAPAETLFGESLDWSRRQHALSWELRTATSLARLMVQQGRDDEARGLLLPVYRRFTEGFATKDLVEARSLLASLGNLVAE